MLRRRRMVRAYHPDAPVAEADLEAVLAAAARLPAEREGTGAAS